MIVLRTNSRADSKATKEAIKVRFLFNLDEAARHLPLQNLVDDLRPCRRAEHMGHVLTGRPWEAV